MKDSTTEIYKLEGLFEAVQLQKIFDDGKTFVDCIPRIPLSDIAAAYHQAKSLPAFDLREFVHKHFDPPPVFGTGYQSDPKAPVSENIRHLWTELTREPSKENSSLINLPRRYIVPGGRFREIYYWDSYFTMLGLKEHGRIDLIEDMVFNFGFLIDTIGHIPNGNRSYYISRSQPPFFALMVQLLAQVKQDQQVLVQYESALLKEYRFWQHGSDALNPDHDAINRVVLLPDGSILNRYYDANARPREESYAEDMHMFNLANTGSVQIFRDLRAGAESGWDFSSRWFADGTSLSSIQTTSIVPVDLNCLLYMLEKTLAGIASIKGDMALSESYEGLASRRKSAILKYCWNEQEQFFCDYHFPGKKTLPIITAAGLFPLFIEIASEKQSELVASNTAAMLLKPGGLVTTPVYSGQQWDAPNGWAPLQWIGYKGLQQYGHQQLSKQIAERWTSLNEKVFAATGKMMEKYNVEDLGQLAGGGEYEGQDGFGWTNGVYLALKNALS